VRGTSARKNHKRLKGRAQAAMGFSSCLGAGQRTLNPW
jgi:hypothetical protein